MPISMEYAEVDLGVSVTLTSNTFFITDVANSNISESIANGAQFNSFFTIAPNYEDITLDTVLTNNTFFITDVANSNISESIANGAQFNSLFDIVPNVEDISQPIESTNDLVIILTYAATDGVAITVESGSNTGNNGNTTSSVASTQVWFQS